MRIARVDPQNAVGLIDKVVGLGKEIVGTVFDDDRLKKAGQVQQDKGTERLKALKAEAEAQQHQARAAAAETTQRGAQRTKEAVND